MLQGLLAAPNTYRPWLKLFLAGNWPSLCLTLWTDHCRPDWRYRGLQLHPDLRQRRLRGLSVRPCPQRQTRSKSDYDWRFSCAGHQHVPGRWTGPSVQSVQGGDFPALLLTVDRTYNVQVAIISFIVIYGFAFAIGWAPISYILSAEIPSQQLRDKTSQMGFIIGVFVQYVRCTHTGTRG